MTFRPSILFAGAFLALSPPALAQSAGEPSPTEKRAQAIASLMDQLRPLAAGAGLEFPDLAARVEPLVGAAIPMPPSSDVDWAFDITFDSKNTVAAAGSSPGGRQTLLNDAQGCRIVAPEGGPVVHTVHFRRIQIGELDGHQCVMAGFHGETWVMVSYAYAEGSDRHLTAEYGAAGTIMNDPEAVRAWVEPVRDANIALAVALTDIAVDAGLRAEFGNDE